MSRIALVSAALAGALVLASCGPGSDSAGPSPGSSSTSTTSATSPGSGATGSASPSATPGGSRTSGSTSLAACMKPYALGNQSRSIGQISGATAALASRVSGMVIQADWDQLEPGTPGRYDTTTIDQQLAYARAHSLPVRLRVIAGTLAPDYVKKLGGAPIPFYDHQQRIATTIGRFWRTDYQARWQSLMTYLASRYDTDPLVREVNISGTGVISAEPMLLMSSDTIPGSKVTNGARLLAAGATEAQRRAALMADIAFMQRTWTHTHTTLFAHPYQTLQANQRVDLSVTESIIRTAYTADPGATVFGHTGASEGTFKGSTHSGALEMYDFLIANHYPFMAQTQAYSGGAKNAGVGSLSYVMTWLASRGAYSIELPTGWQSDSATLGALSRTSAQMASTSTAAFARFGAGC